LVALLVVSIPNDDLQGVSHQDNHSSRDAKFTPAQTYDSIQLIGNIANVENVRDALAIGGYYYITSGSVIFARDLSFQSVISDEHLDILTGSNELMYNGHYLFAVESIAISIVNISDPLEPTYIGFYVFGFQTQSVVFDGTQMIVATQDSRLLFYDCSDPTAIILEENVTSPVDVQRLCMVNSTLYAFDDSSIYSLDISTVTSITVIDEFDLNGTIYSYDISSNHMFVALGSSGVRVLDISDSSSIEEVYLFDDVGQAQEIAVDRDIAYISAPHSTTHLLCYDISQIDSPVLFGNATGGSITFGAMDVCDGVLLASGYYSPMYLYQFEHDLDNDGLMSLTEARIGTDDQNPDTDGDQVSDGQEYDEGTDPLTPNLGGDSDGDGLSDLLELEIGTSLISNDTDQDGLSDLWEYERGLDPTTWTNQTGEAGEALTSTIVASGIPAGATILILLGTAVLQLNHPVIRQIRKRFLFFGGLAFLAGVLLFAPLQMNGPIDPGENTVTSSNSFNFIVEDSVWYTNNVTIKLSYYAEYLETVHVTVNLYEDGALYRSLDIYFDMGSPYQGTEYETRVYEFDPGNYTVSWSSDPNRDVTVEMTQEEVDMTNLDQRQWPGMRMGLLLAGGGLMVVGLLVKYDPQFDKSPKPEEEPILPIEN
jgi:hypothetical protein